MKRRLGVALLALCLSGGAMAAGKGAKSKPAPAPEPKELSGQVSRVIDGDTLWVASAGASEAVVVRIEGIDAPESCQPGGAESKQALTQLALHRNVTVRVSTKDDYGRTVGKVFDGALDIGDRMVRDGQAWSMRYQYDRGPYVAEERMAQALKRGVHAEGGAVMPRDFRKRHGPCEGAAAAGHAAPSAPVAATASTVVLADAKGAAGARCDGRQYCSQMTSCQEAKWFLRHCPGVKLDGNRDGVPCEKQWCR
jgi:endonuclease YncB( thermonuclease family)